MQVMSPEQRERALVALIDHIQDCRESSMEFIHAMYTIIDSAIDAGVNVDGREVQRLREQSRINDTVANALRHLIIQSTK